MRAETLRFLSGLFVPRICYSAACDRTRFMNFPLCLSCYKKLNRTNTVLDGSEGPFEKDSAASQESEMPFDLVSLFQLEPVIKELIHGLKYQHYSRNGRFLASHLKLFKETARYLQRYDICTPVPLHPLRKRERGFNQSEVIGRVVSRVTGIPLDIGSLSRSRYTNTQTRKSAEERENNLKGAFTLRENHAVYNKRVLLIDDVCTTGSTLMACREALLLGGASEVGAFTLAKVKAVNSDKDYQLEKDLFFAFAF